MTKHLIAAFAFLLCCVTGCFTVSETPFPQVAYPIDRAAATNITLTVRGFTTTLTDYKVVNGYQTVYYDSGPYRPWGGPGIATAHTTTLVPQQRTTDAFLDQAKTRFEDLGFNVMSPTSAYTLEARFSGPITTSGEAAQSTAWTICSLLTCTYNAETWQARVKIHDNRTGQLVHSHTFSQRYEVTGFSPIPLFGISYYDRTTPTYMQCWCLSALTEQIIAESVQFFNGCRK